jgi:hypothetical protein
MNGSHGEGLSGSLLLCSSDRENAIIFFLPIIAYLCRLFDRQQGQVNLL